MGGGTLREGRDQESVADPVSLIPADKFPFPPAETRRRSKDGDPERRREGDPEVAHVILQAFPPPPLPRP